MLYLRDIKNYLTKYKLGYSEIFIGDIDTKLEKVMSIKPLNTGSAPNISIGGRKNNAYEVQSIAILVHWNRKVEDTQEQAYKLYDLLSFKRNFKLSDRTYVHYLQPRDGEPKYVGKDDASNIQEFVLEFYVYYSNLKQ